MIFRYFLVVCLLDILFGCQIKPKPTEVYENHQLPDLPRPSFKDPLFISEDTVVIDARAPFAYAMAHIRKSVNLNWKEFSQREFPFHGRLNEDLYFHARRLARLGISPESQVIVIDKGREGNGEAGRLAWTFYYMGIDNVSYASEHHFKMGWTNSSTEGRYKSKPTWKPILKPSIYVKREEVLRAAIGRPKRGYFQLNEKKSSEKKQVKKTGPVILDVRGQQEYLSARSSANFDLGAINIPWTEFFDRKGRPKLDMIKSLKSVGLNKNRRLLVISNQGVRSAAVTMALLDLGFKNAGNYAGGYLELVNR